ncbi:MAG: dTMP kinase [Raoultibacter sp.]|jgi:dTMP kinase
MKPTYILVEGGEGGGKSTVCTALSEILNQRGMNVLRLREPGGTPLAEHLRDILLSKTNTLNEDMDSRTEMLLFLAARSSTMNAYDRILANEPNTVIISDRGFPSTYVYQAGESDVNAQIYQHTWEALAPENRLTVLLTCSYETSVERRKLRVGGEDRIEQRQTKEVFDRYNERFRNVPGGFDLVIDTEVNSVSDVVRQILAKLV